MESIFTLGDADDSGKNINMDELYETKKERDLAVLKTYNKILARVHKKVLGTSRGRNAQQFCWYVVPELLIGVPHYEASGCAAYLIDQLTANGFTVKYTHPNLLMVSWSHWIPSYVRDQLHKKAGLRIDGFGNPKPAAKPSKSADPEQVLLGLSSPPAPEKKPTDFRSVKSYEPTGKLLYNLEDLRRIERRG